MKTQLEVTADGQQELREANSILAIGTGLGALGVGSALLVGATCPLCVIVAPALIGVGAWKRFAAGRANGAEPESMNTTECRQKRR